MSNNVNTQPEQIEVVSMQEAAEEFGKRLVKLYGAEYFVREGKHLREHLVEVGVEAGACLESIARLSDKKAKIDAANRAITLFSSVEYTVNVMYMLSLYTKKQVAPVISYCKAVINALAELMSTVPEARKVIKVKNPISVTGAEDEEVNLSFGKYISSTETSTDGMADGLDDVI